MTSLERETNEKFDALEDVKAKHEGGIPEDMLRDLEEAIGMGVEPGEHDYEFLSKKDVEEIRADQSVCMPVS